MDEKFSLPGVRMKGGKLQPCLTASCCLTWQFLLSPQSHKMHLSFSSHPRASPKHEKVKDVYSSRAKCMSEGVVEIHFRKIRSLATKPRQSLPLESALVSARHTISHLCLFTVFFLSTSKTIRTLCGEFQTIGRLCGKSICQQCWPA